MARYGFDYGSGRGRGDGSEWWRDARGGEWGAQDRFGTPEREFDRWGRSWKTGDDPWAEGAGWSRPEINLSQGSGPMGRPGGYQGYSMDEWGAYDVGGNLGRGWRTGEPWGSGRSRADELLSRDLMTENPEAVTPDTTLSDVARRMRDLDVGIIPVVDDRDGNRLRGVITDRDIAVRAAAEGKDMMSTTVGDYMSRDVATVRESSTVRDVFTVMKRHRVRRVPVTDDAGRLVGIIAQADLAVDYARLDEERELEVGEVIERISEPARPRYRQPEGWGGPGGGQARWQARGAGHDDYERDLRDRLRDGWHTLRREARHLVDRMPGRGYDREHRPSRPGTWR